MHAVLTLTVVLAVGCSSSPEEPGWPETFGYSSSEVVEIEIGEFGYPNIPVTIDGHEVLLPFDTGNMVGVSLSTTLFDQLGLSAVGSYDRLDGAGELVATLRVSEPRRVEVLGRDTGHRQIHEIDHPTLPGLFGPADLVAGHFTLDYETRRLAVAASPLPPRIPGYQAVPLVRSERFPSLILVRGTIEGRGVVMELDTGKSRTVVNPDLALELDLRPVSHGVRIDNLQIGTLSFAVRSAKEVDQTSIDPGLTEAIQVGVGSDILSQFVWTVDYSTGLLWVPEGEVFRVWTTSPHYFDRTISVSPSMASTSTMSPTASFAASSGGHSAFQIVPSAVTLPVARESSEPLSNS